jgi:hypothetical protein
MIIGLGVGNDLEHCESEKFKELIGFFQRD